MTPRPTCPLSQVTSRSEESPLSSIRNFCFQLYLLRKHMPATVCCQARFSFLRKVAAEVEKDRFVGI
jgi:hypothetical protein